MRLYIIGVMVGALGLVAAGQVRADERCGLKSGEVLEVRHWNVEQTKANTHELSVFINSKDPKAIKDLSGSIEFFAGEDRILTMPLNFLHPLQPGSEFMQKVERKRLPPPILAKAPDVQAFACVAHIEYQDGSGVIIN